MSNITSASGEASLSSGNRLENGSFNFNPQSDQHYYPPPNQTQPVKKKRNQPGNPDPDAEVVAMSPKTLLATNGFVCEICNKGFQRDQNLQLHRRGHNLPWKLKKRSSKEVRKKVYVCPETSCVHHHPSRALGDLTGIKKHFCRKHGEKKWKCSKCSKRYAVQSDWKVHYKICGTREYRCDCGTLFSRRDSFITHRAFCDARAILGGNSALSTQAGTSASYIDVPIPPQFINGHDHICALKKEHTSFNLRPDIPPWLASHGPPPIDLTSSIFTTPTRLNQEFPGNNQDSTVLCNEDSNPNPSTAGPTTTHSSAHQRPIFSPHLPATALLRKAVQMGAANISSKNSLCSSSSSSVPLAAEKLMSPHQQEAHVSDDSGNYMNSSTTGFGLNLSPCEEVMASSTTGFVQSLASCGNKAGALTDYASPTTAGTDTAGAAIAPPPLLESQDMVTCVPSTIRSAGLATIFGDGFNDDLLSSKKYVLSNRSIQQYFRMADQGGGSDGMTSDFLGLTTISHGGVTGVMNIAGTFGNRMNTSNEHQN